MIHRLANVAARHAASAPSPDPSLPGSTGLVDGTSYILIGYFLEEMKPAPSPGERWREAFAL